MRTDVEYYAERLNILRDLCHNTSVKAGWWSGVDIEIMPGGSSRVADLTLMASKIALIHSECSEMLEGLRKGLPDDHLPNRSMEEVEAADILIRLFDYAGARNLDLSGAVAEKLIYNAQRADHKPEARAAEGGKKF